MIVKVFGKPGCSKCTAALSRLHKLIESSDKYREFVVTYMNIRREEGLVALCRAEVINPQRIPAVVLYTDSKCPLRYSGKLDFPQDAGDIQLKDLLGVQTDYDRGNGVIPVPALKTLLDIAADLSATQQKQ